MPWAPDVISEMSAVLLDSPPSYRHGIRVFPYIILLPAKTACRLQSAPVAGVTSTTLEVMVEGIWGNGLLQKSMRTLYLPAGRSLGSATYKDLASDLFLIGAHSLPARISPAIAPSEPLLPSLRNLIALFTPNG